ncbi:T9SS type A sorting domain-containing protein [Chryseobacterium sp.]|uniref:T9SS type A sorting domain-containing protein n=1 Tax=Chryseobacterium sp. TaxID=1871047 RepID=UPI00289B293B|nr:T9SS type A sorting domain-containing protein [Chryseobacterium sp.]
MKKILLSLILCVSLYHAQTTITKAFHDPSIGDVSNNVTLNGTVDNSATGSNATFQNSSLTQGSAISGVYTAPVAAEVSSYPGSTIKYVNGATNVFYKQTAAKLEITALVTTDATLNFSANNGTYISYPAALGYAETDQVQGTFTSPQASGLCKGTINITADAAGTLLIGSKTYTNVLRIKSVQNINLHASNDTFFLVPIGTVTNTSYTYYDNLHKFPIMTSTNANINVPLLSLNQTTVEAQALNEVYLAVKDTALRNKLEFYPNPATDFVRVKNAEKSIVTIFSSEGKILKKINNQEEIQVSDLPSGVYFITAEKDGKVSESKKLIKK